MTDRLTKRPESRCQVCGVSHYHLTAAGIETLKRLGLSSKEIGDIQALDTRLAAGHDYPPRELPLGDLPPDLAEDLAAWAAENHAVTKMMAQEEAVERSRRLNRERQARFKQRKRENR